MDILITKTALIEAVQEQFNCIGFEFQNQPNYSVDFVLRNKATGLPLGGFVLVNEPIKEYKAGWKRLNTDLPKTPIYFINLKKWFMLGEMEIIKWGEQMDDFQPVVINNVEPVSENAIKQTESFNIRLTQWNKNPQRFYVNGDVDSLFYIKPDSTPKVYIEDGVIKCYPFTKFKPNAEAHIKDLWEQNN